MEGSFDWENWRGRVRNLARPKAAQEIAQMVIELIKKEK